ncbi:hypothetical protein DMUE_2254 [Dictyocoela muelleri]|nr:hypothetical protein DMUE_2254 [Dictyocoela muelleri]
MKTSSLLTITSSLLLLCGLGVYHSLKELKKLDNYIKLRFTELKNQTNDYLASENDIFLLIKNKNKIEIADLSIKTNNETIEWNTFSNNINRTISESNSKYTKSFILEDLNNKNQRLFSLLYNTYQKDGIFSLAVTNFFNQYRKDSIFDKYMKITIYVDLFIRSTNKTLGFYILNDGMIIFLFDEDKEKIELESIIYDGVEDKMINFVFAIFNEKDISTYLS